MPVMTSPGLTVSFFQPFASIRVMAGPPTCHFSTLPSSLFTSSVIIGCGFSQANSITVPFTVTSLELSIGHEWCADSGTTAETSKRMPSAVTSRDFIVDGPPLGHSRSELRQPLHFFPYGFHLAQQIVKARVTVKMTKRPAPRQVRIVNEA